MSPSRRRPELRMDQPLDRGRLRGPSYDPEQWGRLSERIARFIGSWKFIAWMTAVIVTWLLWNIFMGSPEEEVKIHASTCGRCRSTWA